jgi:hypothetical protein
MRAVYRASGSLLLAILATWVCWICHGSEHATACPRNAGGPACAQIASKLDPPQSAGHAAGARFVATRGAIWPPPIQQLGTRFLPDRQPIYSAQSFALTCEFGACFLPLARARGSLKKAGPAKAPRSPR